MKNLVIMLVTLALTGTAMAQDSAAHFAAFSNLIGSKWESAGKWTDGTPFKQEIVVSESLRGKLIRVQTYSNEATTGTKPSLRNEGIRAWDGAESKMRFWEFDIFGGITEGYCTVNGNDIYYHYNYNPGGGVMKMTDGWIQKDKDTYEYKVGLFENGVWTQLFLDAILKRGGK